MLCLIIVLTCCLIGSIANSPNPSIIIVGSGPSGIAAATKLLKNNFTNIKILEAENRIGGRINSIKFGDAYVDLGAEFCHGEEDNIVYFMVKDLGILQRPVRKYDFLSSDGEIVKEETSKKIYEFLESLKSKKFLTNADDPNEKQILAQSIHWVKTCLNVIDSSLDIYDINIISQYRRCKGNQELIWNGIGYKTILEIMMQRYPTTETQLPIDDKILLQKEVINITNWQNGDHVTITTTDGSTYEADHVVFTPSVGVLKAKYQTLFNPTLPEEKVDAIKNIGFGAILKIIMHFSERWWKDDVSWPFLWTEDNKKKLKEKNLEWLISIAGIFPAENNPKVLIAWYAGSYVPFIESLSDEQVMEGQQHVMNTFLAYDFNITIPDKILRTTWCSNPHFQGTYSYESVKGHLTGGSQFRNKLAMPLLNRHNKPVVVFAGEATHPHYFSTVHGAIESGYREAQRIIDFYQEDV